MKVSLLVIVTAMLCWTHTAEGRSDRRKRGALNLGSIVSCYKGISVWEVLLNYNGYGCYCGLGGSGIPLDDIDSCCREHDQCYEAAVEGGECTESLSYSVSPQYRARKCGTANTSVTCKPARSYRNRRTGRCAEKICECDVSFGKCLIDKPVDPRYKNHDRTTC